MLERIFKPALYLAFISICVKLLGPAKNILIAHTFGVSRKLDAYFIAQNLIDIIAAVFTFTIVILAVPAFMEELTHDIEKEDKTKIAFDSFINQNIVVSFLVALVLFGLSHPLAQVIPGFSGGEAQRQLSNLLSLLSLAFLFSIPCAVITGYFYSRSQVVLPSGLTVIPTLTVTLSILFLSGMIDIYSIPTGFVFGNFVVFVILFFLFIKRRGFTVTIKDFIILRKVKNIIIPTMIFAAGGHLNLLIDQIFTSRIKDGGVSILTYAQFFIMMPFAVITLPILTAAFPAMSRANTLEARDSLYEITSKTFLVLIALMLPIVLALMFFRTSLIDLFYNHGNFDSSCVEETASVLLAYAPVIFFLSLNSLIQRVFFTKKEMFTLMMLTLFSIAGNIILDLYLSSIFSIVGIALATLLNDIVYFLLLLFILNRRFRFNIFLAVKAKVFKIFLSGSFVALTFLIVKSTVPLQKISSKLSLLLLLTLYLAAGITVFVISFRVILKFSFIKFIKGEDG